MSTETSNFETLKATVIENSQSNEWETARLEWKLLTIYDAPNQTCCCGHYPITENCVIVNEINGKTLIVGNVCVNKFEQERLTVPTTCRTSLKKVCDDTENSNANPDLLKVAARLKIISKKERTWYNRHTHGPGSRNRFNPDHDEYDQFAVRKRERINILIKYGFRQSRPKCRCNVLAKPRMSGHDHSVFYSCYRWNEENRNCCQFKQNA
jgi:hypothetical protein